MQFNLLWSGHVNGMKKGLIDGVENTIGTVGSWHGGKLYLPDATQLRDLIPYRFKAAFDRSINWHGLPQIWMDATNAEAPLTIRLYTASHKRLLVTIYLQPLKNS